MKVSIITPSYNQGQFLEETIVSVLKQDYKNMEYIVIDGGSTDNSVDIIRKYQDRINYWVSEKDSGQTHAINKGFRRASGHIVGWLNSDDILCAGTVKNIAEVFENNPGCGIVYGQIQGIDKEGKYLKEKIVIPKISQNKLLNINTCVPQPGSFYLKDIVKAAGYLDMTLNYVMDYDLWIRMLAINPNCIYIPKIVSKIRRHDNSKTMSLWDNAVLEEELIRKKNHGKMICKVQFDIWKYKFVIGVKKWYRKLFEQ